MASIGEKRVTIGVDPHPGSHTATAVSHLGEVIGSITVDNSDQGCQQLREWVKQHRHRCWAIEGAGNRFVAPLVSELLDDGEQVYGIPPSMTAQYRSRRGRKKDDKVDAENAAKALLANPGISHYLPTRYEKRLKELTRSYQRLSHQLKASRMASKTIDDCLISQVTLKVVRALEDALATLKREIEKTVRQVAPELLEIPGVGPIVASVVLAEAGRITRFANRDHFVAFAGCAPIRWESGAHQTVRVNPGGNRRLNWAVHIIVICRLRIDTNTRAYRDRKLAEGKTQRQVIRLLKTYACRELYKNLKRRQLSIEGA
jgi:transposase